MNFSRDLTLLASGHWPKSERGSLSNILKRLNDDMLILKRFGESNFRFRLDRLQDENVDGIEVWQVYGRDPLKEVHPEPYGIIELFPRADEFLDVNFFHEANSPDFGATYDYLWQLALALRHSGMAPISNFPGPISQGFKKVEAMVIVPDSREAVKDVLLNINEHKTYLDLSGELLAGAINVGLVTSRAVHLSLDVVSITPKFSNPNGTTTRAANGLVAIHLQKKGQETIVNIFCHHDAMVPYVVDLLNRFKLIWRGEQGLWQAIEAEEQRLLQLDDTNGDGLETAVSGGKVEHIVIEPKDDFYGQTVSVDLFGLKGNIPDFVAWVGQVLDERRFEEYPIGEGAKIMVLPLAIPWQVDHPAPLLELTPRLITAEEDVFESGTWVIRLWVKKGGKRIDVTAECRVPALESYFEWLLERIAISWEGAKEALERNRGQQGTAVVNETGKQNNAKTVLDKAMEDETALRNEIITFQKRCNAYLLAFYKEVYPSNSKLIDSYSLGSELGFSKDDTNQIVAFWKQRKCIRRFTTGGRCMMPPEGFIWVENNLLGLELPSSVTEPKFVHQDSLNILVPKASGRPPDPINDEAYQLLLDGKDKEEVFGFWCQKNGITDFSTPQDRKRGRDAFNKAMKRREQRRNRT